nr:LuxR C-terminal-related transcriptional regulator [Hoeflea prorocentri]
MPKPSEEVSPLSHRECEVLTCLADGKNHAQAADTLNIAERTILYHVASARTKLGCRTRVETVAKAIRLGLI